MSTALEHFWAPFDQFLNEEGVTEICINQPGEVYVEKHRQFTGYKAPALTEEFLISLATLVAEYNHKEFPAPLLSGKLPNGERIQFVFPPACENSKVICSIRRHHMRSMTLNDYQSNDSFYGVQDNKSDTDIALRSLFLSGNYAYFLEQAIQYKKNIIISGGTGTGKTTFLNACLKCIPEHERLITIEDTRETELSHQNAVHLLFNENDKALSADQLFRASLRLRPDRIFLSELRGVEAWSYLRAINSGHPGSMTTVHADSPHGAFTQLVFMMQQAGFTFSEKQIREYIESIIDIVIQLKRDASNDKIMYISDIYYADNP